jgi:hypothetical protein
MWGLRVGIFSHKLDRVVLTLLSSCGAYSRYSVCHPTGCLLGVMYIRFSYDDMCTGFSLWWCCRHVVAVRSKLLVWGYLYMRVCLYRLEWYEVGRRILWGVEGMGKGWNYLVWVFLLECQIWCYVYMWTYCSSVGSAQYLDNWRDEIKRIRWVERVHVWLRRLIRTRVGQPPEKKH